MRTPLAALLTVVVPALAALAVPSPLFAQNATPPPITPTSTASGATNRPPGAPEGYPLPEGEALGRTSGIAPLVEAGYAFYSRTVHYGEAPDGNKNLGAPHLALGLGLWVGDGLGDGLPDLLADFKRPFGIRFGYIVGGAFSPGGDAIELDENSSEDDFSNEQFEFEIMGPWWTFGVGPDLVISEWEFFGTLSQTLRFRGQDIAADERIKQTIVQYGFGMPFVLIGDWNFTLIDEKVPSLFGVMAKYQFLEVKLKALDPVINGTVSSHVIMAGAFLDWGIARWMRLFVRVNVGLIPGYDNNAVAEFKVALEFTHMPAYWLDDHIEMMLRLEVEGTFTGLGHRYLFDPAVPEEDNSINWIKTQIRLGVRIWF